VKGRVKFRGEGQEPGNATKVFSTGGALTGVPSKEHIRQTRETKKRKSRLAGEQPFAECDHWPAPMTQGKKNYGSKVLLLARGDEGYREIDFAAHKKKKDGTHEL